MIPLDISRTLLNISKLREEFFLSPSSGAPVHHVESMTTARCCRIVQKLAKLVSFCIVLNVDKYIYKYIHNWLVKCDIKHGTAC